MSGTVGKVHYTLTAGCICKDPTRIFQTEALEGQDLPRPYLAHLELEGVSIIVYSYRLCMQVLQEQEAQREVLFSSDAKAARRKSAASAMLPRIFDTLRAIYGPTGPAVKLYDQACLH